MNARSALAEIFVQCRDMDASLAERLSAYSDAITKYLPSYAEAANRLVTRLTRSGAGASAPRPGEPMPPFVLADETGRLVSLEGLLAQGPLAMTFNRGHWCP